MNKLFYLVATTGVALVVVFDIVTGQGPPQLQSFLAGSPIQYNVPPRVTLVEPVISQFQYQPGYSAQGEVMKGVEPKIEPLTQQEYEKDVESKRIQENAGYETKPDEKPQIVNGEYEKSEPTPPPPTGMFGHLSNVWRTLTNLGRRTKRQAISPPGAPYLKPNSDSSSEWSPSNNQGYIYFKIPKNSICYN